MTYEDYQRRSGELLEELHGHSYPSLDNFAVGVRILLAIAMKHWPRGDTAEDFDKVRLDCESKSQSDFLDHGLHHAVKADIYQVLGDIVRLKGPVRTETSSAQSSEGKAS